MKTPLLLSVLLFASLANAQNFTKYYGYDGTRNYEPTDVTEVSTGGYLISGFVNSADPLIENFYN